MWLVCEQSFGGVDGEEEAGGMTTLACFVGVCVAAKCVGKGQKLLYK